jgi:Rieske Fe-S protein
VGAVDWTNYRSFASIKMNRPFHKFLITLTSSFIAISSQVFANEFPESYINQGLAKAQRGISIDVSHLKKGELLTVQYVGRPIFVYRRTDEDIATIEKISMNVLSDPIDAGTRDSIKAEYGSSSSAVWARLLLLSQPLAKRTPCRSLDKNLLVVAGWSTESGCALTFIGRKSKVLFRDPCTGAEFDSSGRIFSGTLSIGAAPRRASYNLAIPPYRLEGDSTLVVGPASGQAIPELDFTSADLYTQQDPTKLLIAAARYNDMDRVKLALQQGAKADYFKLGEGSPIDAAVIGSSMAIIKLLVVHGAELTPHTMQAAEFIGREDVVKYLASPHK